MKHLTHQIPKSCFSRRTFLSAFSASANVAAKLETASYSGEEHSRLINEEWTRVLSA